jgi:hypothetical protein
MAFDAASNAQDLVLYGGDSSGGLRNDTWVYAEGNWSQVAQPCSGTPASCPPRLSGESMAYDPVRKGLVLVGGLTAACPVGCDETVSDGVYLWANGSWSSLGHAPTPVFGGSMAWYAAEGCMLLFGGDNGSGPTASSWCFNASAGWAAIPSSNGPSPRWGAAMTNLSTGSILLIGGDSASGPTADTWEFSAGRWRPVVLGPSPQPAARAYASLIESPAAALGIPFGANSAILYGGESSSGAGLSDTWTFSGDAPPSGATVAYGNWSEDTSAPTPPGLFGAASASDFAASRVILFGGESGPFYALQGTTWGYFHPVAILTVSATELWADTNESFQAYAAGGEPPYTYSYRGLPAGCAGGNVTNISCVPVRFGLYNITLTVTDQAGRQGATNLTVQVDPSGSRIYPHSEFAGLFYTGVTVNNSFGVSAMAWGNPPASVVGTLSGATLVFHAAPDGWVAYASDMGAVPPGSVLHVSANFTNWTIHAALPIDMVVTPGWMQSFLRVAGASLRLEPSGAGPWNESYLMNCPMSWALGGLLQFGVPTPGFAGSYELLPITTAEFNFTSSGNVTLIGFMSSAPSITLGPVTISSDWPGVSFSAFAVIGGSYATRAIGPHTYTVDWISAYTKAGVNVTASYTVDIFPSGTPEGEFGLSATISVSPSIAFSVVLGPSAPDHGAFVNGLDIIVKNLAVELELALSLSVQVGIDDLFEIGLQGAVSVAALFQTALPHLAGVWVNASVGGFVQFLFFRISFTFWRGTIYHWAGAADPLATRPGDPLPSADQPWALAPRYYNTSSYDAVVWNASATNGTAIEDIYPQANPAIAGSSTSALLLYTSDDVARSEQQGLGVKAMELDASTGTFVPVDLPSVPGAVGFAPQVEPLRNGSEVALWTAVPYARLSTLVPDQVTGFELVGSTRTAGAWSTPSPIETWGYPLGYALDACGQPSATPLAAVLVSPQVNPTASTPERLLEYDALTGALVENVSVSGLDSVTGFDCSDGWVFALNESDTPVLVSVATGATVAIEYSPGSTYAWVGASPVVGSTGTVALLFRGPSSDQLVLLVASSGQVVHTLTLPENTSGVHAFAAGDVDTVFAGTPGGIYRTVVSTGQSNALSMWHVPSLVRFGVAEVGSGFVAFGLSSNGSAQSPIDSLWLLLQGPFTPSSNPSQAPKACTLGGLGCTLASVFLGGLLGALVLAGIVVFFRGQRGRSATPETAGTPEAYHAR